MCCRWFVQTVHGRHFSKKKWDEFVKCRPVPGSPVAFAEIEVMLCNIPNRLDLQSEKMEEEKEREGDFFGFICHIKRLVWMGDDELLYKMHTLSFLSVSFFLSIYCICRCNLPDLMLYSRSNEERNVGRGGGGEVKEKERWREEETRWGICYNLWNIFLLYQYCKCSHH